MKTPEQIMAEIEEIDAQLDHLAEQRTSLRERRKSSGLVSLEKSLQREVKEFMARKSAIRG